MTEPLADLYLIAPSAGKSVSYWTIPGKRLDFRGGHAVLYDPRELPWVLQRADVNLVPRPRYAEFVGIWCRSLPEHLKVEAVITLPDSRWTMDGPPTYELHLPVPEPPPEPEPEASIAALFAGWTPPPVRVCEYCDTTPLKDTQKRFCSNRCAGKYAGQHYGYRFAPSEPAPAGG
jgi:hypothetical protein